MSSLDFTVSGMTCQHCAASVTEEVTDLPGVTEVDIDLATGRLHVVGDVTAEQVQAAVAEAGSYTAKPA